MSSAPDVGAAERACLLGKAWLERGKDDVAVQHLRRALDLDPEHREAHRLIGYWHVRRDELASAVDHLEVAANGLPAGHALHVELTRLRQLAGLGPPPVDLVDHPEGKIRFRTRYARTHHRSGWRDAVEALHPLHSSDGVLFEDFLEDPFAIAHPRSGIRTGRALLEGLRSRTYETQLTAEELRVVPFHEPWVGVLHNPPGMPRWFHYDKAPQTVFAKSIWRESLEYCVGLFALSEHLAGWLRKATGKPVSALVHPTAQPTVMFDFERFKANADKRIVQVGWWLRSPSAIYRLPLRPDDPMAYRKLRLVPDFSAGADVHLRELLALESAAVGVSIDPDRSAVEVRAHLSNDAYDALLAENIVFIELYDASANNTVVECIARATPLLVNRLPAVEEYLGRDYPLYCADVADAAGKAMDAGRLQAAHEYLLGCEIRPQLDPACFRRSVEASEIYQRL